MLVTVNKLREMTGKHEQTIKKLLATKLPIISEDGNRHYNTVEVLPLIYNPEREKKEYDIEQERARLAAEQADGKAIDNSRKRKELVRLEDVHSVILAEYSIIRRRLFVLPNTIATEVASNYDLTKLQQHDVREQVYNDINEALEDLNADDEYALLDKITKLELEIDSRKHT